MILTSRESCTCCGEVIGKHFSRRQFLQVAGAAGLAAALPTPLLAATGNYEAMLLSCIDPRFQEPVFNYMKSRGLVGKYSQFTIAGAAIGVVAPAFKDWRKTYWHNLAASVQLHSVPKVIAIDHRDCGAATIAYGAAKVAKAQAETDTHKAALMQFRKEVAKRHPKMQVELGLIDLDGKVEMFS